MKFRNGALGQLLAATSMWPGSPRRIYIAGRDGTAEVLEDQLIQWKFRAERPDDAKIREQLGKPTQHGGGAGNPMAISHVPHRRNLQSFFDALDEDRDPPLNGVEAAKAVAIIAACYESARTRGPVTV
jgi:predicted dehydrogenase